MVFAAETASTTSQTPWQLHTLDNGMKVLLWPQPGTGLVSINTAFDIGVKDEDATCNGCSHFVEHMLFKGTRKRGVLEIMGQAESRGGYSNAYTWFDLTVYQLVVPKEQFPEALNLQVDMVFDSIFPPEEYLRERQVIVEEIQLYNDNPDWAVSDKTMELLYRGTPYGQPILGYKNFISTLPRETLSRYYRSHYAANRATVILVGDFEPEQALALVRQETVSVFPVTTPQPTPLTIRALSKPLEFTQTMDIDQAYFSLAWLGPDRSAAEYMPLSLYAAYLSDGESALLSRKLVDELGIATEVSASTFPLAAAPSQFVVSGICDPANLPRVKAEILALIEQAKTQVLDPTVLDMVKNKSLADFVFGQETVKQKADRLAFFQMVYGLERLKNYPQEIQRPTGETIVEAVRKYLKPESHLWVTYLPKALATPTPTEVPEGALAEATPEFSPTPVPPPSVQTRTLSNGLRLVAKTVPGAETVCLDLVMNGGYAYEPAAKAGLANLLTEVLPRGAGKLDADAFAAELDKLGVNLNVATSADLIHINLQALDRVLTPALNLFSQTVLEPRFDKKEVDSAKQMVLGQIRARNDDIGSVAHMQFMRTLAGTHPYHRDVLGEEKSVTALARKDLQNYWGDILVPENMTIAVVGGRPAVELLDLLEARFSDMKRKILELPEMTTLNAASAKDRPVFAARKMDRDQEQLYAGSVVPGLFDKDYPAFVILEEVLNASNPLRVWRLREEQGLAYTVYARYQAFLNGGIFAVFIGTSSAKAGQAMRGIDIELSDISSAVITSAELDSAKRRFLGAYVRRQEPLSAQAGSLARQVHLGFGTDYFDKLKKAVENLTPADIYRVAQRAYPEGSVQVVGMAGPLTREDFLKAYTQTTGK